MITLQDRIDAAVEQNITPDEYFSIWDEPAQWQLDALKEVGLKPHHKLLDIGCGAMRFGLTAVDYLDDGNYYGIDAFDPYIRTAMTLARKSGLKKKFHLLTSRHFEFNRFSARFDFINAQSVFTHMSEAECELCLSNLSKVVNPGAVFLFTYLIGTPHTQGLLYLGSQPMHRFNGDDPAFFEKLGQRHGAKFELTQMPHITGQHVALYRFQGPRD